MYIYRYLKSKITIGGEMAAVLIRRLTSSNRFIRKATPQTVLDPGRGSYEGVTYFSQLLLLLIFLLETLDGA